jgi:hypothetical protein
MITIRVTVGSRIFSFPRRPDQLWSHQFPIQWVPETLSPGVTRPGREADHSHPISAEAKKTWTYTSTARLHGVVLNQLTTGKTLPFTRGVSNNFHAPVA